MASPTSSSNPRAFASVVCGALAVLAVPAAIWATRRVPGAGLVDAAYAIPVGFLLGVAALLFARGARGAIARRLERVGGAGWIRAGKVLAVAGLSVVASSTIAVGVYELLLRLEH
ncbi:MAG: hypothetical protein JOZ56_00235 [Actinobacteria bacterium]|nr:hypothetical protein [Actinomycetota bacterium]MBV8561494.1 hypothetical protein [Actinomycetota bacterium]